jgi:hypothetical protein
MTKTQENIRRRWITALGYARQRTYSAFRANHHDVITTSESIVTLRYHGNPVARFDTVSNILTLDTCGFTTPTTRRRFEVLCSIYGLERPRIRNRMMQIGSLCGYCISFDLNRLGNARSAPLRALPEGSAPLSPVPESDLFT